MPCAPYKVWSILTPRVLRNLHAGNTRLQKAGTNSVETAYTTKVLPWGRRIVFLAVPVVPQLHIHTPYPLAIRRTRRAVEPKSHASCHRQGYGVIY